MSNTLDSNGFDTGSNYRFGDKMLKAQFPRSLFDLSHLCATTIPNAGVVFPLSVWRTLPTDEYDISVRSLLRVLPQVVPLYSRQRLYIYAFYSRMGDLWENWNAYARKGMSGNLVKTVPVLSNANVDAQPDGADYSIKADTLGDWLGFPIGCARDTFASGKFSALPYMMYTRIFRDYFFNKNFAVGGSPLADTMPWLFPDNDDHFRLNDDGEIISLKENNIATRFCPWDSTAFGFEYDDENSKVSFGLFAHNYPDDYFTSALPFQQRGEAPTLNLGRLALSDIASGLSVSSGGNLFKVSSFPHSSISAGTHDYNLSLNDYLSADVSGTWASSYVLSSVSAASLAVTNSGFSSDVKNSIASSFNDQFNSWLASSAFSGSGDVSLSSKITLNNIRELAISQLELERMARTDGSYAEFGQVFFGVSSKNAIDYKPVFIGGSYTAVSFSEVLQTSASTGSSALGAYGGHGIAADTSGYLGHVFCDDYGYIMVLACLMPDVYYSQGIDRHWTELNQSDLVLPDRTKLGMQPILNQELFLQSYDVVDDDGNPVNENLWAYQDVFDDYRYMNSRIHGKIADSTSETFFPYTQSRKFDELPNWSREFVNATDVRKDYLAAPSEDAYTAQFSIDVRAVRPLPYKAVPAEIIN